MQAWIDRLHGYTLIAGLVLVRSRRLREPLMRREFDRQLHETGMAAMPVMGALAVLTGASLINQVMALVGTTNPSAMQWLFYALFQLQYLPTSGLLLSDPQFRLVVSPSGDFHNSVLGFSVRSGFVRTGAAGF